MSTSIGVVCVPPPPPGALFRRGDSDGNGNMDITDGIYLLDFMFLGGPEPPPPFPDCGPDPTIDELTCDTFPPCLEAP